MGNEIQETKGTFRLFNHSKNIHLCVVWLDKDLIFCMYDNTDDDEDDGDNDDDSRTLQ